MTGSTPDDDRTDREVSETTQEMTLSHTSGVYKVLGELAAADGAAVLGHNTATSGTAVGVQGVTDSPVGYGLYTPDDALIGGTAELATLAGSLTGGTDVTDLVGDSLGVDGSGALTWTGTYRTNSFPASGTTWNAVTGLSGATPFDVTVDARELGTGRVRVESDGSLETIVDAGGILHTVVEPTSSLAIESEKYYSLDTSFDTSGQDIAPYTVAFNGDGSQMFTSGGGTASVHSYDLPTPWDIDSATSTGNSVDVSTQDDRPRSVRFKPDGTKMYVLGGNSNTVYSYDLPTTWDITSATSANSVPVTLDPRSIAIEDDGTQMFVLDRADAVIHSYTLSTAWKIDTASASGDTYDVPSQGLNNYPHGVAFENDGTQMFVSVNTNNTYFLYTHVLSTPWDLTSARLVDYFEAEDVGGIAARGDGTSLYVIDAGSALLHQYGEGYTGTGHASVET